MMNKREVDRTALEIAVIGMAGRFPGAKNINEFWDNLKNGRESVTFFSDEDLENVGIDSSTIQNPNYVKAGGVVQDVEYFDASFFSYIPAEAEIMDPQMRFFHECAWQALEDAGYDPGSYEGLIGLYAGAAPNFQWEGLSYLSGKIGQIGLFSSLSLMSKEYLTTKISYKLDLRGPSSFVHTACSTSLVAIHWACRAILNGECHMALAGGVKIVDFPPRGYRYEKDMILSPDGHCRAFDAKARGTINGNGIGIVVLKRLKNALKDRDHIYAVIKGTAINNDGNRKVGYTAPSVEGQAEVIRTAMAMARVDAESIGYIEAHGTGTPLGDQVEIEALEIAFNTDKKRFCGIGSVKTNIGHLDAAAGVSGFIKAVLALKHRLIPPSLHFETSNPAIDDENSPFYVVDRPTQWENHGQPLRAGVSSFGIGGTNAHAILEEAPVLKDGMEIADDSRYRLILLSAKTPPALQRMTQNLVEHLTQNPGISLAGMAYTLQQGRQAFQYRGMAVCPDIDGVIEALSTAGTGKFRSAYAKEGEKSPIFMFSGLGSQYVNMGADLYRTEPIFRREMDRCFAILKPLISYDLKEILYPTAEISTTDLQHSPGIDHIEIAQLVVFLIEYTLAKLIMNYGIKPHAMIGYSLGEYTAACLSGVFSLEDALKIIVARGQLIGKLPTGTMLSIPMPAQELIPLLDKELSIAIDNGPSCIVAGPHQHLDAFQQKLKEKRYLCLRLPNSYAIHSRMMEPILKEFEEHLGTVKLNVPQIPYISNVTGDWITVQDALDPGYWSGHMLRTVRFADGIDRLKKEPNPIFIEIGPGRDLSTLLIRYKENDPGLQSVNLIRPPQQAVPDNYYLSSKIGHLWLHAVHIDWEKFHADKKSCRVSLPTYPFEKRRFWFKGNPFKLVEEMMRGQSLTPGKVNIEFIDAPGEEINASIQNKRPGLSTPYYPPSTETEQMLVDIWENYFGIKPVGIDDDFFELGGDSLKAMTIIPKIFKETGVEVPIGKFFTMPTIDKLAEYIKEHAGSSYYTRLEPVEEKEYYPLSSAQERLYILQQMVIDSTGYNMPAIIPLAEGIREEKLETVFKKLIERHESLRTAFVPVNEEPVQKIHRDVNFSIGGFEIKEKAGIDSLITGLTRPFDLSAAPLLRVNLVSMGTSTRVLFIDMHHIITDGISQGILANEFQALYTGEEMPPLRLRYKDYSGWHNSEPHQEAIKHQENYWMKEFPGEIPVLNLPTDYRRPSMQSFEGNRINFEIGEEETRALKAMALSEGSTLFMVSMALYNILLSKLSGQEDIVIGTPTAGRRHADLEKIIGMFVNTLSLRNFPAGNRTFREFLGDVKERTLKAFENQEYPFEELVDKLSVERDIGRNPLFDIMLVLQNLPIGTTGPKQTENESHRPAQPDSLQEYENIFQTAKFDITLSAEERGRGLFLSFQYCTKLFKRETIERYIIYFKKIVSMAVKEPGARLSEIEILSGEEKKRILYDFNDTEARYPEDKTIHRLFEEQVEKVPDNIALHGVPPVRPVLPVRPVRPVQLTYRELNERSEGLAGLLIERGVRPDTIVGIMVERSVEMVIGIFGILEAGGAYMPIDPEYPEERVKYMLADSGAKILLTANEISSLPTECIFTPEAFPNPSEGRYFTNDQCPMTNDRLAYVIYTSGTTGKPKGVLVEHRNAVNTVSWFVDIHKVGNGTRIIQVSDYTFDASVNQVFGSLISGAGLYIVTREIRADIEKLRDYISYHRINIINFVPGLLKELLGYGKKLESLHTVLSGAEKLDETTKELIIGKGYKLYNQYGPTETTIDALALECSPGGVSLGKPISNVKVYILDKYGTLLPIGVAGELYIKGAGVARGYLNRPELTAGKFILPSATRNPFEKGFLDFLKLLHNKYLPLTTHHSPLTIYKTGDLARWLPDGNIEFMGRIDHQVKIRGYRIELGEIENCLLKIRGIKEAVVSMQEEGGDNFICAYFVSDSEYGVSGLRENLSKELPDYMIPYHFVRMEKIPLTANGKVDWKALPGPEIKTGRVYSAPANKIEEKLAGIWAEILGIEKYKISIDTSFFQLGGHSLKATILTSRIFKEFEVPVPLAEVFNTPTIKGLAGYLRRSEKEKYRSIEPVEQKEYYSLSSAQKRLYFLQQFDLNSTSYNISVIYPLGKEIDKNRIDYALRQLITRFESLRTSFVMVNGKVYQEIHAPGTVDFPLEYFEADEPQAAEILRKFIRPFDLSKAPLIRSGIIKLPDDNHIWMVDIHHIVSDGTSQVILTENFLSFYNRMELEPLKLQYKDFSDWQNGLYANEKIKSQFDYWLDIYSGEIPRLNLYTDFKRPKVFTFAGDTYRFVLEREETIKFKTLNHLHNGTLYMNILAVLSTLFYKYTEQEDIIIGSGIAGRTHADIQDIVGMFVNTLAMRNYPAGEKTYESFLREVIANSVKAFENQDVQFEELVEKLNPERDPSRNPIFDIGMVLQNFRNLGETISTLGNPGQVEVSLLPPGNPPTISDQNVTSKFDMTFFIREWGDEIHLRIEYYSAIFKEATIRRLVSHLKKIVETVIDEPSIKIKDIEIITPEEKQEYLYKWNETYREYPGEETIPGLFENQVVKNPSKTAVILKNQSLSYTGLEMMANRTANYLVLEKHLRPGEVVGIVMDRTIDLIAAIIGVLKAGCAYIPIEPTLPENKIKNIIDDAGVGVVYSQKKCVKTLNRLQWECKSFHTYLCMDSTVILKEEEAKNELMDKALWEYVGSQAADEITGGGWTSSYTREPLSKEEMEEYGANAMKKLTPIIHREMRVLEIGCASGITMYQIAPEVRYYHGVDISGVIIEKNKEKVKRESLTNITLSCLAAHEIDQIEEKGFDLVILNSVIQSFHGHNYLRRVIEKCIAALSEKGYIFIGDVMDQDLKAGLVTEMTAFKRTHPAYSLKTKTDWSAELFVSRAFFEDIMLEMPGICDVEFSKKIHTIENELTKFRYDTLFRIDKTRTVQKPGQEKQKHQHDLSALKRMPFSKTAVALKSRDSAYIIYTSGTTGKSKGVVIDHRNLVNYLEWGAKQYITGGNCYFPLCTSISFDLTVTSIFLPLITGNTVDVYENDQPGLAVLEVFKRDAADIVKLTPSHLKMLQYEIVRKKSNLKKFIVGGEALESDLAGIIYNLFTQQVEIYNEYGPTEATVGCMIYKYDNDKDNRTSVPIGIPIDNVNIYILDMGYKPVPLNAAGEICISGDGLAQGYLNQPELTNEKFNHDKNNQKLLRGVQGGGFLEKSPPGRRRQRLYRTGDLARWLPGGTVEFLGRIDQQVKIRGYRIELGEIEVRLLECPGIERAAVLDREIEEGKKTLGAYFVSKNKLDISELRGILSKSLPGYMIPSYFIQVEKIPLTVNGKIDRKALNSILIEQSREEYVAPRNEIEQKIAQTWKEVLKLEIVGINENFFDIGGTSLDIIRVSSKFREIFDEEETVVQMFRYPTIRSFGEYLVKKREGSVSNNRIIRPVPLEKMKKTRQNQRTKRLKGGIDNG